MKELYFDRQGRPINLETWAGLMVAKQSARAAAADGWTSPAEDFTRVGLDRVGETVVSTVWVGLNHNCGFGPPLIFETMVFELGGEALESYTDRYSTEAAALAGHERTVAALRHAGPD